MFEYLLPDGTALPENEVIKLAVQKGLTPDDYVKKNKLTLRPKQKKVEVRKEVAKPVAVEKPVVEKVKPAPIEKFNAKQFAKDLGASKGEGFYTKGEKNIEKSGIKIKQLEDKTVQDVFDNFSDLSYTNLSPEEKNTIDDRSVELLSKKYKVGEDYSLSSNDIELKSKELLALASKKKKAIEGETYSERILDATAAGLNYAGEMFASMPETIYRVFALPQNAISMMTGDKSLEASPEKLKETTGITNPIMDHFIDERNRLGKKNEIYDNANYDSTSIATNLQDGNYTDAFKLLGSGLAESAPISVGLMMGGAEMGIAKAAASSTALFAGPNVREQKEKKLDDSELSTVLKGFGIAGAEGVFSAIGEGSLGKVYKDIIKKEGADVGSKIFKDGLVVAYQTALKKYGAPAAMLGEGLEEVATTVTQNLINEKPAFEGAMDSFIAGVGGGAVWGAPVNIAKATQGFKDGVTVHQINKTLKDQPVKTIKDVFNPNTPITNAQVNISLIPNAYKILNSQLDIAQNTDEITGEEADAIRKEFAGTYFAANKLKELKLSEDNNAKIANLLKERGALKTKVDAVNDPTLTTIQSNRIKELNVEIEGVIKDNAKAEVEKGIALSEKSILETGEKVYEKPLGSGKSFEVFDTAEEAQSAYDKWADENGKKSEDITKSDGFKLPNGQMLINKERAIEVTALNVAPHELLHNIIDNEFTEPSKAEELKNKFLGTLSKTERDKLDIRILAKNEKGERLYDDEYLKNSPSEYATQFFELARNGDIKWSDNVKESLIRMWKGIFKPIFEKYGFGNIEFTDGRDVYNFIKDYSKSIEKGTLSTRAKKLLKQGEQVTGKQAFSKTESEKLKEDLAQLVEDEYDFDPDEYENQKKNLESKIKLAVKKEAEAPAIEKPIDKNIIVYHGAPKGKDVTKISDKGVRFFATDKKEADEYARINSGVTQEFSINSSQIVNEDIAINKIKELGLAPKNKEFEVDDVSFYELIDTRFEESLSKEDIVKLFDALKKDNIKALSYNDGAQVTGKSTTSIAIIDPSIISKPIKEKAVSTEEDEVKDIIRSEKGAIASDKVQKIYEERGENGAGEIIKLFKPITRKIANKRRDAPGFNEDDLISEIENGAGGLFDLIRKYDPTKGVPLAAYINKNLPLRAITASRRVLDKEFTSDVETEVNVRATETTDQGLTINIPEKPKYKNALEAKVIEPETFKAIENKIISTVRLLKSRMDAPVTLNRTVTPIIAEIRDEIGKQLDIDIKTMLGGKKDGILRKELLRTKRYILENMTTTWLMGKDGQGGIPQAIQKRIDGKYVNFPDWVGQKIDREAMSTDLAGRTSGAELVRRLPNVFNNVSDVDFLAQIIGPDGNPIRGRKESVSKAMAEEIAFDIIKADIEKEGSIYDALKANQERQGVVINESFGNEFARQSDRGNIKLSLTSKRDLKWEDDGVIGVKTGFKVGDEDFNIYLTSIGYQGLPDKVTDTLYDLIDKTGLNEDLVLNSLDGQSMNLQFAKGEEDYDISGTAKGKAGEILSIVINGTIDYAKANDTKSFIFVASEPSRVRLYNTISKLIANKLGWFEANEKGVYIVSKIFPTGEEANWDNMPSIIQNMVNKVDKPYDKNAADIKFSKTISKNFNKILEDNVGVKVEEEFSDIVAKRTGAAIGKYRFFVPPSAADLELLIYDFLGYGKVGEKQQKFFNKVLFEPYAEGIAKIDAAKQSIKTDYKALLKSYPKVSKELGKLTPDGNFTYDQALRVSMWAKAGIDVPGLLKEDITKLNNFVNKNAELSAFRDGLIATGRQEKGWVEPSEYWDSETIVSDLHNITEKVGRQTYLKEFKENSEEMFSKENLNKIETIYGSNFRDALEDSVYSMINGTNREGGAGRINAAWLNWINNSTGAIMFWNTRSAVLQTIGAINYLNWRDNNPLNAAKAFANQPQYWKDFAYIWNSDKMKERRSGLKEDVSSAEIANAAAGTTSKANAVISYLLKKGFLPTQIGDSFAIASGGAAFYRNRINYNIKQGMSEVEAEEAAWKEFLKVTDQTQQSGDPRDVSQQQRSAAGRLVLAFQNTSMQQARLVKKAGLDLINNRGDAKTNISKIVYYTAVQNIIFGSLQSALFATIFSSDSDEEKEKKKQTLEDKWLNIGNNIVDTILRGSGMAGAVVATIKNVYLKYNDENKKGFKAEYAKVLTEAANIAPPLGSKFTKMMGAMNTREFEKDVIAKRGWDVTQNGRLSLSPSYSVLGKTAEAATNLPLDRFVTKVNNLSEALDSRNKSWQRIALAIGYSPYVVGVKNEEADIIKAEAKEERKIAGKEKAAETRKINKEKLRNMPSEERRALREKKREEKRKLREKKRNTYK